MQRPKNQTIAITVLLLFISGCSSTGKRGESDGTNYSGHGRESVDEKTLSRFAPPALEPGVGSRVRSFLEARPLGVGIPSPDGKTLYFSWGTTGVSQIWKVDGPMHFPIQLTSGSDPTSLTTITPDGKYLVVSRDRAGEENPGVYLLPTSGGPLIPIQHKKGVRTFGVWVANDADTVFYMANDIKPDSFALYSYSISTGKSELLFSEPGLWSVHDVYGDRIFLMSLATGAVTREYYKWDLSERKLIPLLGQGEKEIYSAKFGPSQHELIVLTSKFGDFQRLYRYADKKFNPITPDVKMDVSSFDIDFARYRIYIRWNDGGYSRLEVRDARSLSTIEFPKFPGADHVVVGSISRFGRYAAFAVGTSLRPPENYLYDWKDRKLTQWTKPSLPEVDATQFVRASLESYPARDGVKIPMWVWRPKKCAANPCQVVVNFHGGPKSQSLPGYNRIAQLYVSSGFVFVEPNVRGSDGYGRAWFEADDGPKRLQVITDIEDAALYLRKAFAADGRPPKIGVMGGSYGGYSALMAMSRFAGSYDAGVSIVGMSNLRSFLLNTAPYRRSLRTPEYGDPEKDKEALTQLSPVNYLNQVKSPLLIIQGVSDPRVPAGEAIQMHELLAKRGIQAPLILFADEGHGSAKIENSVLEIGHTLQFFQKHLQ